MPRETAIQACLFGTLNVNYTVCSPLELENRIAESAYRGSQWL